MDSSQSPAGWADRRLGFIDVAAAVIFRDGKLLITQRPAHLHLGGLWEFPGGKVNPGESFEECLAREVREELAMEIEVGELIDTVEHHYSEKSVRLKFFRCHWRAHEPRAIGCQAFRWILPEELANFAFPAADARLIQTLSGGRWREDSGPPND